MSHDIEDWNIAAWAACLASEDVSIVASLDSIEIIIESSSGAYALLAEMEPA